MEAQIIAIPINVLSPINERIFQLEKWENKVMVPVEPLYV